MTTDARSLRPDLCATIAGRCLRAAYFFSQSCEARGDMALSTTEIEHVLHEIAPVLVQDGFKKYTNPAIASCSSTFACQAKRIGCSSPWSLKPHGCIYCPAR